MECVCGNTSRWWHGRSEYLVCAMCFPDPCDALEVLARRLPGGVQRVQRWFAGLHATANDSHATTSSTHDAHSTR
jgi:hypothetical protein